ncbi:hypothetical protein [Streptomyces hesseae]|uniref:Secreted protein n=1 Tax=Streptomyces hesseae TaxID=3075519 RepID=A0ABU2SWC8_9ACTN|nr:hypothetical protein [Streptomyces sp. DSM 40473]MDT0452330.1 hypothetical protein [Streptomyces sp. DSM 40473]
MRIRTALAASALALTTVLGAVGSSAVAVAPAGHAKLAAECGVRSDGRLHCGNKAGAKGYADRSYRSATRGTLRGTFSWFQCWGHGDPHPGGNDIWYWTQLDNGAWGNVPAVDVKTGQDPAPGLREC